MRLNKEYQATWSHWLKIKIIGTAHFPPTAAFQKLIINNFNDWNCMKHKSDQTICEFINFRTTCIYIYIRGPGALAGVGAQAGPSSKPLFITLWPLWRMGRLPWGGCGAGLGSQKSQKGLLGCQSHPKVVQIWTISRFLARISQNCGLKFLS